MGTQAPSPRVTGLAKPASFFLHVSRRQGLGSHTNALAEMDNTSETRHHPELSCEGAGHLKNPVDTEGTI